MTSTTGLWAGLLVLSTSANTWAAESAERVSTSGTGAGLQGMDLLSMAGVGILALLVLLRRRPPH